MYAVCYEHLAVERKAHDYFDYCKHYVAYQANPDSQHGRRLLHPQPSLLLIVSLFSMLQG
ncbi:hypothetical protein D3C71_2051100 [compost metagenome]